MITQTQNRVTRENGDGNTSRVDRGTAPRNYVSPNVNITESKDGYLLEAEMPGVNKEGLELLLEGNELTIVGHRQTGAIDGQLLYRESSPTDYRRIFVLDPTIDSGNISVQFDQGVLKLTLPKAERVKPRRIAVAD
jgi:HSP20 family protein